MSETLTTGDQARAEHGTVYNTPLRDEVGNKGVHEEAEELAGGYKIIEFKGLKNLPPSYHGVIYSNWLKSLRRGCDYFNDIEPAEYYRNYKTYITELLKIARIRLAVLADDNDVVLGFSVSRANVIDYVHVLFIHMKGEDGQKKVVVNFRGKGIGSKLVPAGIDTFTHMTKYFMGIWKHNKKYRAWKFNPFA